MFELREHILVEFKADQQVFWLKLYESVTFPDFSDTWHLMEIFRDIKEKRIGTSIGNLQFREISQTPFTMSDRWKLSKHL